MKMHRLNSRGIKRFRDFLQEARREATLNLPSELLDDSRFTETLRPTIDIEQRYLLQRSEAAEYLHQVLSGMSEDKLSQDEGLWTWLSVFLFDSVCPKSAETRLIRNDYCYVFEPMNPRHFYRHLLFCAWNVKRLAPVHNRLFLQSRVAVLDKLTTEVMKRLFLLRIPCIFEVLDRLYWDPRAGRARPGVTGSITRAGDLTRRFPTRIRQLEKTYDLAVLTADQLIELLGSEFDFSIRS